MKEKKKKMSYFTLKKEILKRFESVDSELKKLVEMGLDDWRNHFDLETKRQKFKIQSFDIPQNLPIFKEEKTSIEETLKIDPNKNLGENKKKKKIYIN